MIYNRHLWSTAIFSIGNEGLMLVTISMTDSFVYELTDNQNLVIDGVDKI